MLNHLDDPDPHAYPDDFRDRVKARARVLRARRRLAILGATAVALVALGATGLYGRALMRLDDVDRLTVAGTGDPAADHRTVLVAGVDRELGQPARTDTVLVVRLEAGRASVLSIPRDLAVTAPGGAGEVRVNSVAAVHGYSALLEVLADNFGIDIDNVIEIDFAGFARLVDLVGGIDVQTAAPLRDETLGLEIDTADCHRLDGTQALALARTRHLQHHTDGRWTTDPTGDLGRVDRHPVLLTAGLQALTRTRPDPLTADRLAGWLVDHAAVDDTLDNQQLIALVRTVMGLDPENLSFTTLPVDADTLDGGAVVLRPTPHAQATIEDWRTGRREATVADGDLIAPCSAEPPTQPAPVADGDPAPAPDLVGSSLLGGDFDLRSHQGRHVVIAMTATWCVPCIEAIADLTEFANRRPDVTMVSVAVSSDPEAIAQLHQNADADWPLLNDTDGEIARRYRLPMPAYVIVHPDGTIGATVTGPITPDQLDELTR